MTTPCTHPTGSLEILGLLPDGYVKANCKACGQHGVTVKYSESFEDQLDVMVSDLMHEDPFGPEA